MAPEEKLRKTFELSDFAKKQYIRRLHKHNPDLSKDELRGLLIERLKKMSRQELTINAKR